MNYSYLAIFNGPTQCNLFIEHTISCQHTFHSNGKFQFYNLYYGKINPKYKYITYTFRRTHYARKFQFDYISMSEYDKYLLYTHKKLARLLLTNSCGICNQAAKRKQHIHYVPANSTAHNMPQPIIQLCTAGCGIPRGFNAL